MTPRTVDATAELVLEPAALDRLRGARKEVTVDELASAIHRSFCEPRGMGGLRGEIHERIHHEIAASIFDNIGR